MKFYSGWPRLFCSLLWLRVCSVLILWPHSGTNTAPMRRPIQSFQGKGTQWTSRRAVQVRLMVVNSILNSRCFDTGLAPAAMSDGDAKKLFNLAQILAFVPICDFTVGLKSPRIKFYRRVSTILWIRNHNLNRAPMESRRTCDPCKEMQTKLVNLYNRNMSTFVESLPGFCAIKKIKEIGFISFLESIGSLGYLARSRPVREHK